MTRASPKQNRVHDRKWLDHLRTERCILTGMLGNENETVDPAHIGTSGTGSKSGDDEVLPVCHSLHSQGHQHGEISMFRRHAPDWLIRDALRAYAREMYREWKND